jgi:hypothetical protein
MGELIIDDSGKLDINSVASLSLDELRAWISAHLHGEDTAVPGDVRQGEPPHYLLAQIYPELDRDSRRDIRRIVQEFLRDMSRNPDSSWRGESAHALLLLAQRLDEDEFVPVIREMAEDGKFFASLEEQGADDLHQRLLQSLIALEWLGTREFWREQFERAPLRYSGLAFAGLSRIALQHAFDLLPDLPWDSEDVQGQMKVALRGLLRAHDHSRLGELLTHTMSQLPATARSMVCEFLPEVSPLIEQPPPPYRVDIAPVKAMLKELGQTDFSPKHLFTPTPSSTADGIH